MPRAAPTTCAHKSAQQVLWLKVIFFAARRTRSKKILSPSEESGGIAAPRIEETA
jgi:hypothetical protein